MVQFVSGNGWLTETGSPTLDGATGRLDFTGWFTQDSGTDLQCVVMWATSDGRFGLAMDAANSIGAHTNPALTVVECTGTIVSASNPVVWARGWAYEASAGSEYLTIGLGYSDANVALLPLLSQLYDSQDTVTSPNGQSYQYILEYGNKPSNFDFRRALTNKSLTGTTIIPPADIAWNRSRWIGPNNILIVDPPVSELIDFDVRVSSAASSILMYSWWHDPNDPASWTPSAAYGFVPDAKAERSTTIAVWKNDQSWSQSLTTQLTNLDYVANASNYYSSRPLSISPGSTLALGAAGRPFALELFVDGLYRSYWEVGAITWPIFDDAAYEARTNPGLQVRAKLQTIIDGGAP
jgi:hypothetical protein